MDTGGLTNSGNTDKLIQIRLLIWFRLRQELSIFICNDDDVRKVMMTLRWQQLSLAVFLVILLDIPAARLLEKL